MLLSPAANAVRVDPTRCPLCGQDNRCAGQLERAGGAPQPPCWCTRATFDAALLARVPAAAQRLACLCPACAGAQAAP